MKFNNTLHVLNCIIWAEALFSAMSLFISTCADVGS